MFALPGLIALLVAHYIRPHELLVELHRLPVVPILYALTCFGFLLDLRLGLARLEASPQLRLALPLWVWMLFSVVVNGGLFLRQLNATFVFMLLFLLIAQSVQSFRALRALAFSILAISLFLGVITFVQALRPFECHLLTIDVPPDVSGISDGRTCESSAECRIDAEPGENYACERSGPLGAMSISHGRVRYRGILEDPNELALALVISLPFAASVLARRLSVVRVLFVVASLAIVTPVVIWTSSRTGQVVFVTVIAAYLLRKVRLKGMLAVALLTAPAVLLGGRSGKEADESATERLEAWSAGIDMFRSSPIWGIGKGFFTDHHGITAHNTFLLEAAELGLVGMVLWVGVFYTGFKIVVLAIRRYRDRPDATLPYAWARVLLASLCGIAAGTLFLSLAYHPVIWTYLALPSAFYLATRRHDPEFRVAFGVRDLAFISGAAILWLLGTKVYLVIRGI